MSLKVLYTMLVAADLRATHHSHFVAFEKETTVLTLAVAADMLNDTVTT